MSYSANTGLELLKNWAATRAVVSLFFFDIHQRRFSIRTTARLVRWKSTSILFDLHPANMASEPADFLTVTLDGSEEWSETEDPLGGVTRRFPNRDEVLTLLIVPVEAHALDVEPASRLAQ